MRHLLGPPLIALLLFASASIVHAAPNPSPDEHALVTPLDHAMDVALDLAPTLDAHESAFVVATDDAGMVLALAVVEPRSVALDRDARLVAHRLALDPGRAPLDTRRSRSTLLDHYDPVALVRARAVMPVDPHLRC